MDFNQILISNIMMQIKMNKRELEENMVRHMVLNSIRAYRTKFKNKFSDELIIACDDTQYWRKDHFPFYKSTRKDDREKSEIDWNLLFACLNKIREEVRENFPYKVIQVRHAEADDVIGVLCHEFGAYVGGDPILIISGDKDFKQLQQFTNVSQYSPTTKRFIKNNDPIGYIKEHIIRGDRSDGVPNFLSPDNTFAIGKKQKPILTKKLEVWMKQEPEDFCDEEMLRNWKRNEMMVDLSFVPENIKSQVLEQYNEQTPNRSKLFNYFVKMKLKNLMGSIQEF